MNLQSLIVVALRLMAIDFFLRAATQLLVPILSLTRAYKASRPNFSAEDAVPWVFLNALFIGAILIWVFALPIARIVTQRLPQEISFGSLSLVDCYSIAFIGIGLLYIASHLPAALNWVHYFFKLSISHSGGTWKNEVNGYEVSTAVLPFVIGVVLFVKGRAWAVALAKRHENLTRPTSPASEESRDELRKDLEAN